jgi:hypothetical protein
MEHQNRDGMDWRLNPGIDGETKLLGEVEETTRRTRIYSRIGNIHCNWLDLTHLCWRGK